jgi:hypothetical protein
MSATGTVGLDGKTGYLEKYVDVGIVYTGKRLGVWRNEGTAGGAYSDE